MITNYKNILIAVLIFSGSLFLINGQSSLYNDISHPFVKNYNYKELNLGAANWCIIQDDRGIIYFGNDIGLLEFDGSSWRSIKVPGQQIVRAFAKDDSGRIYLTAGSDIGYLAPDSLGRIKYNSLIKLFGDKYDDTDEIWDVNVNPDGLFFKTSNKIYRWKDEKLFYWDSVFAYRLYNINDEIYSRNQGTGLMKIEGNSIKLIPDGGFFSDTGVFDMIPFDAASPNTNKILITTNYSGLFIYDGKKVKQFKTDTDEYLKDNQIYNACSVNGKYFAFSTQRGGVVIIDKNGKVLHILNDSSGLASSIAFDIYYDKQNGLWAALDNGVARIEFPSPFLFIPPDDVLKNPIYDILKFKNRIYASNNFGLIYYENGLSSFRTVEGSNKPAYTLLNANGVLLASLNSGLAIVEENKILKYVNEGSSARVFPSRFFEGRYYDANSYGLFILEQENENFNVFPTAVDEELVREVIEESDTNLWINSDLGYLFHVTGDLKNLTSGKPDGLTVTKYFDGSEMLERMWNIYRVGNKTILARENGTFTYSEETDSFVRDFTLGKVLSDSTTYIANIEESYDGNYWILAETKNGFELGKGFLQTDGTVSWKPDPQLNSLDLSSLVTVYSYFDDDQNSEILWLSLEEGLVIYNPQKKIDYKIPFNTFIRNVFVNNDSVIFGGTPLQSDKNINPVLSSSDNNITFEITATSFINTDSTSFQYYLEGNDEEWSKWTKENKVVYTNLAGGNYKFHVRAKNIYGTIGQEDIFAFRVLPPWYLSWWAFVLYGILFIGGIFLTDRVMRRKIIQRERNRAKLREAELIKRQADELETVDGLVKVINQAENLDSLFQSLLEQTLSFIPQGEKAAVFMLNKNDNLFHVAFTAGYKVDDLEKITFTPEELHRRYTEKSEEVEKGVYIVSDTRDLFGDERMTGFSKATSMLVMAVDRDNVTEGYVVFDSFSQQNAFKYSAARLLNRFREHAVSAIAKAQAMKTLQEKNDEIIRTQEQLVTQQKLASLGALTAGIAHEIKNPLNFVNNFAEVSTELVEELNAIIENQKNLIAHEKYDEIKELLKSLDSNVGKISTHGTRADSIIKGMLLHSRGSTGEKVLTDINELLDQYVALAYHGFRAQDKEFNITIKKDYDESLDNIEIVPQDISRVFLNIINNSCYSVNSKKKSLGNNFDPILKVSTKNLKDFVEIRIRDNGNGIPENVKNHIFNPFFTTKPSGDGTGLGLSLSYDIIVKQHSGEIRFETKEGEFTEFIIQLPVN